MLMFHIHKHNIDIYKLLCYTVAKYGSIPEVGHFHAAHLQYGVQIFFR
jgi:hypothetical protein